MNEEIQHHQDSDLRDLLHFRKDKRNKNNSNILILFHSLILQISLPFPRP